MVFTNNKIFSETEKYALEENTKGFTHPITPVFFWLKILTICPPFPITEAVLFFGALELQLGKYVKTGIPREKQAGIIVNRLKRERTVICLLLGFGRRRGRLRGRLREIIVSFEWKWFVFVLFWFCCLLVFDFYLVLIFSLIFL